MPLSGSGLASHAWGGLTLTLSICEWRGHEALTCVTQPNRVPGSDVFTGSQEEISGVASQ